MIIVVSRIAFGKKVFYFIRECYNWVNLFIMIVGLKICLG